MFAMARARTQAPERDHVDRFLDSIKDELPRLDLDVEGIVDRVGGLAKRFRRTMDETLAAFELNQGEYHLLGALRRAGAPYRRSPGELARFADLSSGAMTNRLDRLEEAGFIRRLPDPTDRRGIQVELTKKGRETYERAMDAQATKEELVAGALTKAERRELNDLLRKLMVEFEGQEGRSGWVK